MKKLMNRTVDLFVYGILGFSLVSFIVCYFVYSLKYPEVFQWYEGLWALVSVGLFFLIWKLSALLQQKSEKMLILFMCLFEIACSLILNLSYHTVPCSDYAAIWNAAKEMAANTFTDGLDKTHYMYIYNWQLGMAAFESLLIRLFGAHFSVLKCLNTVFLCAIDFCVYALCKKKTTKQTACFAYVSAAFYLPWVLSLPQMTNHHAALLLWFLCFACLEKKKALTWAFAGISAGVLNVLRPYGIVIVLTVICFSIYLLVTEKNFKKILLRLMLFLLTYCAVCAVFDALFVALEYTDAPISQARIPYFKFQKGMMHYDAPKDLVDYGYDYSVYNEAMKTQLIAQLLHSPKETLIYIANKMVRYLGLFDYQFEMTYNHDVAFYQTYPVRALYCISWFQYIGMVLLALRGYKKYRAEHDVDPYLIFFIGNTLVYLFIEAFSSYRFESYPLLLILAALGASGLHIGKYRDKQTAPQEKSLRN